MFLKIFLPLALFILASCEFNPSEIEITNVEKPKDISPSIELNINDTVIYISGNSAFLKYKVDIDKTWIHEVNFFIDLVKIDDGPFTDSQGNFYIKKPVAAGDHYLSMEVEMYAGGKSIASMMGKEYIIKKHRWKVVFWDNLPPVKLLKVEPFNGQLRISWEKTPISNFSKYVINRKYYIGSQYISISSFEIENPNQTEFIDSSFVGGENVEFSLDVHDSQNIVSHSNTIIYNDPIHLYMEWTDDYSKYTVRWTKCRYPGNFKGYHLKGEKGYNDFGVIYSTDDINDTAYITSLKGILNDREYFAVLYQSKATSATYIDLSTTFDVEAPLGPESTNIFLSGASKTLFPPYYIYDAGYNTLYRYNPMDESLDSYPTLDQNADLMATTPDNSFVVAGYYKYNSSDFSYTNCNYYVNSPNPPQTLNIGTNGIGAITVRYGNSFIFDFSNNQKTYLDKSFDEDELLISPNGKFLAVSNHSKSLITVYTTKNMVLTNEFTINASAVGLFFTADTIQSNLLFYSQGKIFKWSCDDKSVIQSVECSNEVNRLIDIDPISDKFLTCGPNYLTVFNSSNLSQVKRFDQNIEYLDLLYFYNSAIFYRGFKYKLKL